MCRYDYGIWNLLIPEAERSGAMLLAHQKLGDSVELFTELGIQHNTSIAQGAPASSIDIKADGKVGVGTVSPVAQLHVEAAPQHKTALRGNVSATSGATSGVFGRVQSKAGRGVHGLAAAKSGTTYGIYGHSRSGEGRGVFGYASASDGKAFGVYGVSDSTQGRGVFGQATAKSGNTVLSTVDTVLPIGCE